MPKGQDTRHHPNRKVTKDIFGDIILGEYDRYVLQHGGGEPPWELGEIERPVDSSIPMKPEGWTRANVDAEMKRRGTYK